MSPAPRLRPRSAAWRIRAAVAALAAAGLALACAGDPEPTDASAQPGASPASCGDGVFAPGQSEQCDDGNTASGDGCSASCRFETCGDGIVQAAVGEECDDGGTVSGDGCSASCTFELCGDGVVQPGVGEQCDDGGAVSGDGCSARCVADVVTILGGAGEDSFRDVAVGPDGYVYAAGGSASSDFPVTAGAWDTTFDARVSPGPVPGSSGPQDVIVARFAPDGRLDWATYVGGAGYDRAYAIEVDDSGVYVGGRAAAGFPTTANALQPGFAGDDNPLGFYGPQDGFVLKLSLDGTQLYWSTFVGEGSAGFVRDIAIDADRDVYVAMTNVGNTTPHVTINPGPPPGGGDSVIAKIHRDGSRVVWGRYLGGANGNDLVNPAIRVNAAEEVFVTGQTTSTDYPTTLGAVQRTRLGASDMALTGLTADGTGLIFSTYLGGGGDEETETHSLALGPSSSVVVAATTHSSDFPTTTGALQRAASGGSDGFVTVFTREGALVASTYLGGRDDDEPEGVAVHATGAVLVSGISRSDDFPVTPAHLQGSNAGDFDQIFVVLSSGLDTLLYGTYVGGGNTDSGRAAAFAPDGSLVVAGHANSSDFPTTDGTRHSAPGASFGGRDATVVGVRP